ncbi:MAG: hypothetical protein Q9197_001552 [Variospora fuerteventurae]
MSVGFNDQEQCWVWSNEGQEYFYDKSEWVRFRVEQEHWTDLSPMAPSEEEATGLSERKSPYTITLEFDTDGTAMLIKKSSPPAPVDTSMGSHLAIYINRASASVQPSTSAPTVDPIQSSNGEDKARTHVAWVNAHRSYFNAMVHMPLEIFVGGDPFQALEALHLTVAVGDLYNGPQVLVTQSENLLVKHFQAFSIYLFQHARLVVDIALRAEIIWLFKDVVCHLAGDEKRHDQDIQDELDPKIAA